MTARKVRIVDSISPTARLTAAAALVILAWAASASPARAAQDGREVYQRACAVCHAAMPPKLGDKRDWEPRVRQGNEALVAAVIKGKGAMPPRGGNAKLTDGEIKAAVDYMLGALK